MILNFKSLLVFILMLTSISLKSQTSTEFWFAPPEVSSGHVTDVPVLLRIASSDNPAVVKIYMPANPGFNGGLPITINMAAFASSSVDLSAFLNEIETGPMDQVLNTGIHITSTESITAYYEVNTNFNPEIFALKGLTGMGTEFYTPFQNEWTNGGYTPTPYTSFDIVASEDNTTIIIYPRVDLEGSHPALNSYSITLNEGQTYSGGVLDLDDPNPAGTAIAADKPISVSVKDDSVPLENCRDLIGDQLVPVEITGTEYIVNKGYLNTPDKLVLTATANITTVEIGGVYQTTLFTGESFEYVVNDPLTFVQTSKPVYAMHITGFGCEIGAALLPPLNCAGSEQVSFTRSNEDFFALNLLVRAGAEGSFQINGDATLIEASDFTAVPGTGGEWLGAQISYEIAEIIVDQAYLITNDMDVFAMGLINGGATSGCRFGYFSEFAAQIVLAAGDDGTTCADVNYELDGMVSGGSTSGIWSTSGTGEFIPSAETLNAEYVAGPLDILNGQVVLTLTSTGPCVPISDQLILNFAPKPIVNAGEDIASCANNPTVLLSGIVQNAGGGIWSGGDGNFNNNTNLDATYTPTLNEVDAGSVTLTLTSTVNGFCSEVTDNVVVTFSPSPTASAGPNITSCSNNAEVQLAGSVTVAGGGQWSGGTGTFLPSPNALNAIYIPSQGEIDNGSLNLILSTMDNGSCNAVSDNVLITFTAAPTAEAGDSQTICANNSAIQLNGSVTIATGGFWSGGTGNYVPSANVLNPVYTPSSDEIESGSLTLTLTTTGQGNCLSVTDELAITFSPAPIVSAGNDILTCEDDLDIELFGLINGPSTSGEWSTNGSGTFSPNANALNAVYVASALDVNMGQVTLTLTATNIGNCLAVSDDLILDIATEITVTTGADLVFCTNNVDAQLNAVVTPTGSDILWTTSGTGTFSPSADITNPTYIPSQADLISGGLTLTLTAAGSCNEAEAEIDIDFTPAPVVNAGSDQQVCSSNPSINLAGLVNGTTNTGQWSTSGSGAFTDFISLSTQYTPSIDDIDDGQVTLTLTSTNNATCLPVEDEIIIFFSSAIEAYAGENQQVCISSTSIQLSGQIFNGGETGAWVSSGTGTFSNPNILDPVYTFSSQDISDGAVFFTLTSTNNGDCDGDDDLLTVTFGQNVYASAGLDIDACESEGSISLNGFASGGSTTGIWTTSGNGTFDDPTLGNAEYTPSTDDIINGGIELYFTSTNNGSCVQGKDTTVLSLNGIPTIEIGDDKLICGKLLEIDLAAVIENVEDVEWSTNGTGEFTIGTTLGEAKYMPTATDSIIGSISIMAETVGIGACESVTDMLTLTFGGKQTVNAGDDIRVCGEATSYPLNGSIEGDNITYFWATDGEGQIDFPNALDANYTPDVGDANEITFILSVSDALGCPAITDTVLVLIDAPNVLDAGVDLFYCSSTASIPIVADIGESESIVWTTSGTGLIENNELASAIYQPSTADGIIGGVSLYISSTDDNACGASGDTLFIELDNSISADFEANAACLGSPTQFENLSVVTSGNVETITWFFGDQGISNAENSEWSFSNVGLYDVTLAVEMAEGCSSTTTKQVEVKQPPTAIFNTTDELLSENVISFNNLTAGDINSYWDFGTGEDTSLVDNPSFIFDEAGIYQVLMVATDGFGCKDSTIQELTILPGAILPPKTPTGFSPNGDGENDIFLVRGGPFLSMTLTVYNGWGESIFTSQNQDFGWDGTHKGKDQPIGAYFYTVKAITEDNNEYDKSGKLTLIR